MSLFYVTFLSCTDAVRLYILPPDSNVYIAVVTLYFPLYALFNSPSSNITDIHLFGVNASISACCIPIDIIAPFACCCAV